MPVDNRPLPPGAGTTTGRSNGDSTYGLGAADTAGNASSPGAASARFSSDTGAGRHDYRDTGYGSSGRALMVSERSDTAPKTSVVIGAALAGAVLGAAVPFMLSGRSTRTQARRETALVSESVTVNRPAQELYAFWRDFTNLPQFMDNIKSVTKLGEKRSHWVIKAPAGTSVEFDSIVVDDVPGRLIAWQSVEGATVPNRGRVEFEEISSGTTLVRATISYDPPAGEAGRLIARLFQREPGAQARQDLARFKEVMERR